MPEDIRPETDGKVYGRGQVAPESWADKVKTGLRNVDREGPPSVSSKKSIFKVPSWIREHSSKHYDAAMVSTGLYDRSISNTRGDTIRFQMVSAFLKDLGQTVDHDWDAVCKTIVVNPEDVRKRYHGEGREELSPEDTQAVLALDAIFVVSMLIVIACWTNSNLYQELRLKNCLSIARQYESEILNIIWRDIMILENQIPMTLIRNIFEFLSLENGVLENIYKFFSELFLPLFPSFREGKFSRYITLQHISNCEHMLHLVALSVLVSEEESISYRGRAKDETIMNRLFSSTCGLALSSGGDVCFRPKKRDQPTAYMPTAKELIKSGITFQRQRGIIPRLERHLLKAVLYLPEMRFEDDTETVWKNLLAFEEGYMPTHQFKSFLSFMDDLIDTEEDVTVLRKGKNSPISFNGLGDDLKITVLFNSMLEDYAIDPSYNWREVQREVTSYHNRRFYRKRAEFVKTYFSKPWLTVSLVAATILLVATILQTVYTILAFYGYSHP